MIRLLFVVQMPYSRDDGRMRFVLRPTDSLFLNYECAEYVVGVIFDCVPLDCRSLRTTFRTRFNEYISHGETP